MMLIESLLSVDKTSQLPVYLQISNGIINYIRQGILKAGSALPASRALALSLNVHRKTVVAAYDELYAQSWVDVIARKGIYIANNLPDIAARPLDKTVQKHQLAGKAMFKVDDNRVNHRSVFQAVPEGNITFTEGFPDTRIAPVDLMVREYRRMAGYRFTHKYLMYGSEQGSENLRRELARFLGETRGLHVTAGDILITKGVQMALYLCAQVLINKNDVVIVADPGYIGANEVFELAGARLALVPVDEHGIDIDAVEAVCAERKVRMLYVVPHHHQPTTVTLSSERRMRLLELARKYQFAIIEDDYDFDFHYTCGPILPLVSADYDGSVIYVGSFCKTIAPGIRIGFMVAPSNFLQQAIRLRRHIDRQGEHLLEEAMASLLKNGDIGRHLKKANKLYHQRRDTLCRMLNEELGDLISFKTPDGGFAIWVKYQNGVDSAIVSEKANELGLSIGAGTDYYYDRTFKHSFVRIGFASLNENEMAEAVALWKKAILKAR